MCLKSHYERSEASGPRSNADSTLHALLSRVKEEEAEFHGASKDALLSVAEFVLNASWRLSKEAYREAIVILAKYHLAALMDMRHPRRCRELIEKERQKLYDRRCARCGLIITAKESLEAGYGRVCRRKLGLDKTRAAPKEVPS